MEEKVIQCCRCKTIKPISEFVKDKKRKFGIRTICKKCNLEYSKTYQDKDPEKYKELKRKTGLKYKDKYRKQTLDFFKNNRSKMNEYNNKYFSDRYKSDPSFKLRHRISKRILKAIHSNHKTSSTVSLLGCSIEEAKKHIESQFQDGMNWDNHGVYGWHIDHIKPCASFDLTDPEQQKQCFHYTNLQPLWAKDNLMKSDKYQ